LFPKPVKKPDSNFSLQYGQNTIKMFFCFKLGLEEKIMMPVIRAQLPASW